MNPELSLLLACLSTCVEDSVDQLTDQNFVVVERWNFADSQDYFRVFLVPRYLFIADLCI
jgi:hypothetical protein